jgi:hypothetical protein
MLRKAIEDRNLMHLVAKSGNEAAVRLTEELKCKEAPYDPLMNCHWMIVNQALKCGGLYLISNNDYCPVCEAMKNLTGSDPNGKVWTEQEIEKEWIEGPSNAALEYCKEHNLL